MAGKLWVFGAGGVTRSSHQSTGSAASARRRTGAVKIMRLSRASRERHVGGQESGFGWMIGAVDGKAPVGGRAQGAEAGLLLLQRGGVGVADAFDAGDEGVGLALEALEAGHGRNTAARSRAGSSTWRR